MGLVPDDIKTGLQNLAKSSKVDTKVLVGELKEIIANDETIKAMAPEQEEFKIRYAWALLCRRHTAVGQVGQMYIKFLSKPTFGKIPSGKSISNVAALVKRITADDEEEGKVSVGEVELAAGTLWEGAADAIKKLSTDKVYKTALKATEVKIEKENLSMKGLELSANNANFVETTDTTFPTNEEFYKSFVEPKEKDLKIDLDEMDLNRRTKRIDIRVFKVMIIDYRVGTWADGTEYGQYVVTDDSMLGGGADGEPSNFLIRLPPEEVKYERGVVIKCVATVQHDKKNDRERLHYFFDIPVGTVVTRKIEAKPVEKESEDVDVDAIGDDDIEKAAKSDDDEFVV